ncbi:coiled-coil domain-containing protein 1 [Drosophila tropicalis]|uniref:coiled-coil domain-containing protein 1 n=1 Tax=Drosophila tropicalis TaxID=46794 RepID=UPI0035ABD899
MFSSIEAGASASLLAYVIVFITCPISLTTARSYSNGLIFYELASHTPYLPPTVSVSRGRNLASVKYSEKGSIWSTFGQPCECRGPVCGCCAGLKVDQYKFDQKVCANVTFVPQVEEAQLEVYLNERPSSKYGISVRNPIPFCIPVMMGVPMAMCVQMTDVAIMNNQLNMCMDFVVRLATTDLFEMHFQCMRMGLDGLQYVDKNGKPVLPTTQNKDDDHGDDDDDDDENDNDSDDVNDNDNDNDGVEETKQEEEKEQQQQQEEEEEEQREPSPIESEMLMANDQLNTEEEMMVMEEEETPDHAGESDLKPNEVIETITMMHNYTAHGEKVNEEKMPEEEIQKSEEEKQEEEEDGEETTTIPELVNVSENEIDIDDDEDDADKKDTKIEDEAKKEQVIETETKSEMGAEPEEESQTEMATEVTQDHDENEDDDEEEEEAAEDEEEGEDIDEATENEDEDNNNNHDAEGDDEGEVENNDDDEEDDDEDDADEDEEPKEAKKNQSTNGNESSSNSRQAVDDLANEVFNQSKRRRLRL